MDGYPASSIIQAGYRNAVSDDLAVIFNAFYHSQKNMDDNIEFNFKALLKDKIWLGIGHRIDYAINAQCVHCPRIG